MPSSTRIRLRTVEKTGRRMQNSNRPISRPSWSVAPGLLRQPRRRAVAQLELAGSHHLSVGHNALQYLHLGAPALAELDLGLDSPPVVDAKYEVLAAPRHDGALRSQHDLAHLLAFDDDARKQSRAQGLVGIWQAGSELQRAAIDVDQWIDGIDLARERLTRHGIHGHIHALPDADRGQKQLGQLEIDLEYVDLLEVHNRRTDLHEARQARSCGCRPCRRTALESCVLIGALSAVPTQRGRSRTPRSPRRSPSRSRCRCARAALRARCWPQQGHSGPGHRRLRLARGRRPI